DLLWRLAGLVIIVLAVTVVSVSTMLAARTAARDQGIRVRAALGASTAALMSQFLVESLLFAAAGGGLGLACSAWLMPFIVSWLPAGVPHVSGLDLDVRVAVIAMTIAAGAGLLAGLPAIITVLRIRRGISKPVN